MLFKIHADMAKDTKDFFEENPGARAIEEFNDLTTRQMFFVCLVADRDYDSPLRSQPERKRREIGVRVAGWPMEDDKRPDKNGRNLVNGKVAKVESAIKKYVEIQYDEEKAIFEAVDSQIKQSIVFISEDKEEACTVTRFHKTTNIETTFVDQKMKAQMIIDANKMANALPELKETKTKLAEKLKTTSPISEITTYTSQDLDTHSEEEEEEDDAELSTLDRVMQKERKNESEDDN